MRRRLWVIAAGGVLAALGVYLGSAVWTAARVARQTGSQVASERRLSFAIRRLDAPPPAGFDLYSTPAVFYDAAAFHGRLYLAGPVGLFEYDMDGAIEHRFRAGIELPPAAIRALAVGLAIDSTSQELFAATDGGGLLAFDGARFRQIRTEDPVGRKLTSVLPLASGRVLFGTQAAGVLVFDGKSVQPFHPSLGGVHVTALAGDEGSLWVGTQSRGLLHVHAGQTDSWSEGQGMPDPQVLSLTMAGDSVFAGTPIGIAEFRGGRPYRQLAQGWFTTALLATGGVLNAGSMEEGIASIPLRAQASRPSRPQSDTLASHVHRLFEVGDNLYALAENGVYVRSPGLRDWSPVLRAETATLAHSNISAVSVDPSGRLWIGYFDRGLDVVEGGRARHLENDTLFCINRIAHDPAGQTTAVGTANGLVLFDAAGRERQVLRKPEGLIADHVTDVVFMPEGMAVATPAGVTFIGPGGTHSVSDFHGLTNTHVYALAADRDRLLVGTLGGLSTVERGLVRASYTTANSGLRHNWITALAPAGQDWFVGTYGAGVVRLTPAGSWETFPELKHSFVVNLGAMLATATHVYAGSLGFGLYVYDRRYGRWNLLESGLPSLNVTALAAAGGTLYIGTDNGLVTVPEDRIP